MNQKIIMRIIYAICFVVIGVSIYIATNTYPNENLGEDIGEITKLAFLFEYAFLAVICVVRTKIIAIPLLTKNMKYILLLHRIVGVACVALVSLHVAVLFNVHEIWDTHYIEGYLIMIPILLGIIVVKCKKRIGKYTFHLHVLFSLLSIVPFLLHI